MVLKATAQLFLTVITLNATELHGSAKSPQPQSCYTPSCLLATHNQVNSDNERAISRVSDKYNPLNVIPSCPSANGNNEHKKEFNRLITESKLPHENIPSRKRPHI